MLRVMWALVVWCALVLLIDPHTTAAQGDGRLVWRTLETPHFVVHYHEPLGVLARELATRAEPVHARLRGALGLDTLQRVQLVLSDDDDAANGLAGPLPYNTIRLRAVAPDDLSALGDYDDWLTLLVTHEHTHIVHLEHATGLPRLLQRIFGRVYTPQQFLPGWLIEGLAVVEETSQTSGGRARSTLFDMQLRMDALEDRVLPLAWIGFDGEPWPHGNVRYLYGQGLMGFIARRHGERALGRFVEEYGKRLVPYGTNRAMRRATGQTITELYAEFAQDLRARARDTRDAVLARGLIEGEQLTTHGELTRTPRFLSVNTLVYALADERHPPELRKLALDSPRTGTRITRTVAIAQAARLPDPFPEQTRAWTWQEAADNADATRTRRRAQIVYSAPDYHRTNYFYNDLFSIDEDGRHRTRLTHGLRAREPDVSSDGNRITYVVHGAGTSHLEVADLADVEGTRMPVVQSQRMEQIFTPRFSPEGGRIAYAAWSRGGFRDVWLVDVASGARSRITHDRALDRGPVWSPDGRTLYFASDRSGISNLYAYTLATGALSQITNVLGGAFQPDVSPDGRTLVYVGYTSKGYDLYRLPIDPARTLPALPSFERAPGHALPAPPFSMSAPYQPLPTLLPRSWELSQDEDAEGARLVATTSGRDAVGFHSYHLTTTLNLETGNVGVGGSYAYRKARFPVFVSASLRQQQRSDLVVSERRQDYQALAWGASLGTQLAWPRGLHGFAIRPDYAVSYLEKAEAYGIALDPNYAPPRLPTLGPDARLSVNLTYNTARRQEYDISQSWGQTLTLRPSVRSRALGSRTDDVGLSWRAEQFFRFDFRESVLAVAYTGAWDTPVAIGGFPAQIVPIFDYVVATEPAPGDVARLRGFGVRRGVHLEVLQVEYRVLVARLNAGVDTLPLFARRIHVVLFSDVGNAYTGRFDPGQLALGTGAELRFDWSVAYSSSYTLRAGIAQGWTTGGTLQTYTSIARPF